MARKPYTQEEIEFLKKNYKSMPHNEIASELGRTINSVRGKLHSLELKKWNFKRGETNPESMEDEIWKDVPNYEGLYMVSNKGRIKSLSVIDSFGKQTPERIMNGSFPKIGYHFVTLTKNKKRIRCGVHTIVARAFIQNPNNLPMVNHKDENKLNNCVENLEWCSARDNLMHNDGHIRRGKKMKRPILQCTSGGEIIMEYEDVGHAEMATGLSSTSILRRCNGVYNTPLGGYYWKYKNENEKTQKPVLQYDLEGNFIARFKNSAEAARKTNSVSNSIRSCCKGIQKTTHGYIWRYESEI